MQSVVELDGKRGVGKFAEGGDIETKEEVVNKDASVV